MLQPKTYPEMMGKALVFEAEPFITMVDDDNPWAEGLFMVALTGVLVGIAQAIGALLTAASLPPPEALLSAFVQGWRQIGPMLTAMGLDPLIVESTLRQWWPIGAWLMGSSSGWLGLLWVILAPLLLIVQWLLYGLVSHGVALALGGRGQLSQTLGAAALIVAPQILVLLKIIPFVSVSSLLLAAWALLILYRAVEVVHDFSWLKAAAVAVTAPALLILIFLAGVAVLGLLAALGGLS